MEVKIVQALVITAEVCGTALSDEAAQIMAEDLANYPEEIVFKALVRCRRELKGKLTLASILERIDDGWPDPEIALGIALNCAESDQALIVCDEIMAAWGDAAPALEVNDKYAFRQAFLVSYKKRRDEARAEGRIPRNWVSGGGDRDTVIRDGVAKGLLSPAFLGQLPAHLLPSPRGDGMAQIANYIDIEFDDEDNATDTSKHTS